jgi:hypothetical protein
MQDDEGMLPSMLCPRKEACMCGQSWGLVHKQ